MQYAPPYDVQDYFYFGPDDGIYWNYPGLRAGYEDQQEIPLEYLNELRVPGSGDVDPWGTPLFTSSLTGQYVAPEDLEAFLWSAANAASNGEAFSSGGAGIASNPKFQEDLAMFLERSPEGIPIAGGWYQGDNQAPWYANEFVIASLGALAGLGAVGAAGAGAGAAATGGAGGLGAGASGLGGSGATAGTIGAASGAGGAGAIGAGAFGAGTIGAGAGGLASGGVAGTSGATTSTAPLAITNGASGATLSSAGGTGLFGTGITAGQALQGGQLLATGIGALASGGGGGSSGGSGGAGGTVQDQQAANKEWARRLVTESIAPRLAQLGEGLISMTQLANASPNALTQRLSPQIEQARDALGKMFQQTSQRFGPMGGGQIEREQVRGAEEVGGKMSQLFGETPGQAREAIARLIENFQTTPQPPAQIMQTNLGTNTQNSPFNPASIFASLQQGAALGSLANRVDNYLGTPGGAYPSTIYSGGDRVSFDATTGLGGSGYQSSPFDYYGGLSGYGLGY